MEKEKVLKALEVCSHLSAVGSCTGCPYQGVAQCDQKMCKDAIALLKANESKATEPKYSVVYLYTKRTSMRDYCTDKVLMPHQPEVRKRMAEMYNREREVELLAMFRWEGDKCYCKIKCPINPMPVKGEFQAPSPRSVFIFLSDNGWNFERKINPCMFK